MKRTTVASLWSGMAGILIILLGIIHNLGVKEPYRYGFDKLPSVPLREVLRLGLKSSLPKRATPRQSLSRQSLWSCLNFSQRC